MCAVLVSQLFCVSLVHTNTMGEILCRGCLHASCRIRLLRSVSVLNSVLMIDETKQD